MNVPGSREVGSEKQACSMFFALIEFLLRQAKWIAFVVRRSFSGEYDVMVFGKISTGMFSIFLIHSRN